jgi:hypothetical protein
VSLLMVPYSGTGSSKIRSDSVIHKY